METERLKIHVASATEMKEFIDQQTNDILKEAYSEMLAGAWTHSDKWEWYAIWMIELKNGKHIGELSFKELDDNGTVEIGYGISEEY